HNFRQHGCERQFAQDASQTIEPVIEACCQQQDIDHKLGQAAPALDHDFKAACLLYAHTVEDGCVVHQGEVDAQQDQTEGDGQQVQGTQTSIAHDLSSIIRGKGSSFQGPFPPRPGS